MKTNQLMVFVVFMVDVLLLSNTMGRRQPKPMQMAMVRRGWGGLGLYRCGSVRLAQSERVVRGNVLRIVDAR